MIRFSSRRERRLWLSALAVVLAIYSTVGLAGRLADVLRAQNLLGVSFGLGFVLVAIAVIGSGLKRSAGRREMWVAVGVTAVFGMVLVRTGVSPEERTHLFEYGLLGVLVHQALEERVSRGRRVPVPAVLAVALTALLGWLDEGLQAHHPSRIYDIRDVGINALAGFMAIAASTAIARARRWDLFRASSSS